MWKQKEFDKDIEQELLKNGKDRLLVRLLAQRNISPENMDGFLETSYNDMSHPHSFKDMKEAAEIFGEVAKKKGNIAVIGDYDADGIISSTMVKELCMFLGLRCKVFLPSRTKHGYGLNPKTLAAFKTRMKESKYKIDLLFILDCGSSNNAEIKELREFGIPRS